MTAGTPSSAADSFVLEYQPPPVAPSYPQYDVTVANLVGTATVSSPYLVDVVDDDSTNLVFAQEAFLQINSLITDNFQSFLQGVPHDSLSLEIETVLSFTLNTTAVIVAGQLGTAPVPSTALDHAWVWSTNGIEAVGTSISSPPTPNLTSALQDAASNGRSAPFAAGVHFVQLVTRVSTQNFDANGHTGVVAISDFDLGLTFAPFTAAIPEPSSQVLLSCLFASLLARRIITRSQSRELP